jgi:hypothetical protein
MPQRKSAAVALGVTALLAPTLSGCGHDEERVDNQAVCIDQNGTPEDKSDDVRVDDDRCSTGDHDYHGGGGGGGGDELFWYFMGTQAGRNYPPVGQVINYNTYQGTYTPPPSNVPTARGGVPRTGGAVPDGGFKASGGKVAGRTSSVSKVHVGGFGSLGRGSSGG